MLFRSNGTLNGGVMYAGGLDGGFLSCWGYANNKFPLFLIAPASHKALIMMSNNSKLHPWDAMMEKR